MLVLGLGISWFGAVGIAGLDGRRRSVGWIAVAIMGAAFAALAVLCGMVVVDGPMESTAGNWPAGVGIRLRADALGVTFALLSAGVLLAALAYEVAGGVPSRTLPALVLFQAAGLTGLFLTSDVFSFYVFFELAMIAAYTLTAAGDGRRQVGAAFIFAVVNLLGSFLFLIGVAALYHVTGTLEMETAAARMGEVPPTSSILIAVTFLVAFSVKLGLFPFHFWLPAVYGASRPAVAAMLSGALANIGAYGLLRFGAGILPAELEFGAGVMLVLGTVSIIYGALQATSRRSASEVLAYSAIGQVGYVFIALAVGGTVGLAAAVLYAIINALNKTLLFLSIGVRGWLVGLAFVIGAFSVAGVPPAAGFFGKVALFQAGIERESAALVALIFLGGALSFVYMFQIYQHDFWRGERRQGEGSVAMRVIVLSVAAVVVGLGLWPEPLLAISQQAAEAVQAMT
jgi:multicomponent Na+:H+ antiporter subunit D